MFTQDKKMILAVLDRKPDLFSEKEQKFLIMSFGLYDERQYTTREIAKALDIPGTKVMNLYRELIKRAEAEVKKRDTIPSKSFLESIDLSTRAVNALHRYKVYDINDLSKLTKEELLSMRNIGEKTRAEIEAKAAELGIKIE